VHAGIIFDVETLYKLKLNLYKTPFATSCCRRNMTFLIVKLNSKFPKSHFSEKTMTLSFPNFNTLNVRVYELIFSLDLSDAHLCLIFCAIPICGNTVRNSKYKNFSLCVCSYLDILVGQTDRNIGRETER